MDAAGVGAVVDVVAWTAASLHAYSDEAEPEKDAAGIVVGMVVGTAWERHENPCETWKAGVDRTVALALDCAAADPELHRRAAGDFGNKVPGFVAEVASRIHQQNKVTKERPWASSKGNSGQNP